MYMTNLLVETLPQSQRTQETLEHLGLDGDYDYVVVQLLLSRSLKRLINGLTDEEATTWKDDFHKRITTSFEGQGLEVIGLLNLQPMVRTVVIRMEHVDSWQCALSQGFERVNDMTFQAYDTRFIGCFGGIVSDFFAIGKSYKGARAIADYRYIIGKGECSFYDQLDLDEGYSLLEYKYIHLFEETLGKEDWAGIYELLNTIKTKLKENWINNSKAMYVYKEIYSATIRHLFQKPEQYKEEIERLNTGIIQFDDLFDDINEIHTYYMTVFDVISEISAYQLVNPHVKKTLQIIRTRYNEPITLNSVSDELGLSKEYLSRLFRSEMDHNFKSYLTTVRLEKAKELLKETEKDINTIRGLVGYQSPTQFVRAFKAYEGMTPSKYRQVSAKRT